MTVLARLANVLIFSLGLTIIGGADVAKAEYPNKSITFMVGFSAGGGVDTYARALTKFLPEHLGVPAVVVNKPGAAGMIAARAVKNARPDGYMLLVNGYGTFHIKASIDGSNAPATPSDFRPLGGIGKLVTGLIVPKDSPFKSAKDLVKYAKKHPGELRWSHPGRGSLHWLAGTLFLKGNDIKAQDVPFKGGAKARLAIASHQVEFGFMGVQNVAGFEKKLRPLGVTDDERDRVYTDVPTFGEQGLPQMAIVNSMIIWGRKDLPDNVVAALKKAIAETASSDEYQALAKKTGVSGFYFTPEEAKAKMTAFDKTAAPVINEIVGQR